VKNHCCTTAITPSWLVAIFLLVIINDHNFFTGAAGDFQTHTLPTCMSADICRCCLVSMLERAAALLCLACPGSTCIVCMLLTAFGVQQQLLHHRPLPHSCTAVPCMPRLKRVSLACLWHLQVQQLLPGSVWAARVSN
jgi:hypothetical protein